jgi:peptide/nickel transport system permease protein
MEQTEQALAARRPTVLVTVGKGARATARWLPGPAVTILVASFVVYVGCAVAPGDPVARLLGGRATPAMIAYWHAKLGLNEPLLVRYWHWLGGVVRGNLGTSLTYRSAVAGLISGRISTTLSLVAYAAILVVVFGVGLGILGGGVRKLGPGVAAVTALGVAVPAFVAAQVLVMIFALKFGWFPTIGAGSWFVGRVWHLTLPAIALAIGAAAYVAQVTRASIFEEEAREHVDVARGRGLSEALVFRRHVLRNALVPIVTVSALTAAGLIAGAVVVEYAFGVGGLGSLLVESVSSKDYPVVEAITLILLVVFVVTTALIDLLQVLLDPRVRHGKEGR